MTGRPLRLLTGGAASALAGVGCTAGFGGRGAARTLGACWRPCEGRGCRGTVGACGGGLAGRLACPVEAPFAAWGIVCAVWAGEPDCCAAAAAAAAAFFALRLRGAAGLTSGCFCGAAVGAAALFLPSSFLVVDAAEVSL